jgi:hypothetical protein
VERLRAARGSIRSKEHAAAVNCAVKLINQITEFLDGKEWDSETVESIADALRDEGIIIKEPG